MAQAEKVGGGLKNADVGFDAEEEDLARLGLWVWVGGEGEGLVGVVGNSGNGGGGGGGARV